MKLYTLFDGIAKEHSGIFEAKNNDVALRIVAKSVFQSPDPESFSVYCLGFVDRHDEEISLRVLDDPECVFDFSDEKVLGSLKGLFSDKMPLPSGDK